MNFSAACQVTKEKVGVTHELKPKQIEALTYIYEQDKDLIVNLPVGYGKSLIYLLLPCLLDCKFHRNKSTVIVISPLNIIQEDQLAKIAKLKITAAKFDIGGKVTTSNGLEWDVQDIIQGKLRFDIIFCHPEALLNTTKGGLLIGNDNFQASVSAVVIDECHIVEKWGKEFRTAFKKLKLLPSFFPNVPVVAMSGTLTSEMVEKLPKILGLQNPGIVLETPDRPNIFLSKYRKVGSGNDTTSSYEALYKPECDKLKCDPEIYPVTIMFLPISYMSQAAVYLAKLFGEQTIEESVYSLLYSNQDSQVISKTIQSLDMEKPRIRLILATTAAGMGFDPKSVTRVIHLQPPRNISQYLQEIGRAGRQGQRAEAILYFGSRDIAKNIPEIEEHIINYCCNETECLREMLLRPFGFNKHSSIKCCECCCNCKKICLCELCLK